MAEEDHCVARAGGSHVDAPGRAVQASERAHEYGLWDRGLTTAFGVSFLEPAPATVLRRAVSALLGIGLGGQGRHFARMPMVVDGDEGEVARVRMAAHAGDEV